MTFSNKFIIFTRGLFLRIFETTTRNTRSKAEREINIFVKRKKVERTEEKVRVSVEKRITDNRSNASCRWLKQAVRKAELKFFSVIFIPIANWRSFVSLEISNIEWCDVLKKLVKLNDSCESSMLFYVRLKLDGFNFSGLWIVEEKSFIPVIVFRVESIFYLWTCSGPEKFLYSQFPV